jgi:primosomal protein N' (replication factor Y)
MSMTVPVFDRPLLEALRWAAHHYVAPLAVMLERSAPPNLVGAVATRQAEAITWRASGRHPLDDYGRSLAAGRRGPPLAFLERSSRLDWIGPVTVPLVEAGRSVLIIAPTAAEAEALAVAATAVAGDGRVGLVTSDRPAAAVSAAWERAQAPGCVLVGTPRIATWRVEGLGLAVLVEEGRRAMKERQTPTLHARDLMRTRARTGHHGLMFAGPTPSLETMAAGASVVKRSARAWPPVEVIDRSQEPPVPGLVSSRTLEAIRAVAEGGGRVLVFAHRRGYAPAYRCERCRAVRRCPGCGSRPEPGTVCSRCGNPLGPCRECGHDRFVALGAGVGRVVDELRRTEKIAAAALPGEAPILVGSEADLATINAVDLAVAVDADGLILGSHFRAAEEALRVLARLAAKVDQRRRAIIQTTMPEHPVIVALRSGDPLPFLEAELEERRRHRFPPTGELVVVETKGAFPTDGEKQLRQAAGEATVLGPATRASGAVRWLVQGSDLGKFRTALRPVIQRWREGGLAVRIDVDPLEL